MPPVRLLPKDLAKSALELRGLALGKMLGMGKKSKILFAALLASALGLTVCWFSSPFVRAKGYQVVLDFGPSSLQPWILKKLMDLGEPGAEALGYFILDNPGAGEARPGGVGSESLQNRAFVHLGSLKEKAAPAIPVFVMGLKSEDLVIRMLSALGLGQIGGKASSAIPALVPVLNDNDAGVRLSAAQGLAGIGPAAIPALTHALKSHGDGNVRRIAAVVLGEIGGADATVIPALVEALKDEDEIIRRLAQQALDKLRKAP